MFEWNKLNSSIISFNGSSFNCFISFIKYLYYIKSIRSNRKHCLTRYHNEEAFMVTWLAYMHDTAFSQGMRQILTVDRIEDFLQEEDWILFIRYKTIISFTTQSLKKMSRINF